MSRAVSCAREIMRMAGEFGLTAYGFLPNRGLSIAFPRFPLDLE